MKIYVFQKGLKLFHFYGMNPQDFIGGICINLFSNFSYKIVPERF